MNPKKWKRKHKLVSFMLIFVLLFTTVFASSSFAAATTTLTLHGSTYSYLASGAKPEYNMHGIFTCYYGSGNPSGATFCAEHGINSPTGNDPGSSASVTVESYSNELIRKVLYYGYKGPAQWSGFSNETYNGVYLMFSGNAASSKTEACGTAVTSCALTRAYANEGYWYYVSGLDAFWSYIQSAPAAPSGFQIYRLNGGALYQQDLFTWSYNPKGSLTLQKTYDTSNGYSIAGAQYSVFSSSSLSGSSNVGTLTTNASGTTNTLSLTPGTYYVKETKAPTGWKLDPTTHTVTVYEDATAKVTSKETPADGYLTLKKEVTQSTSYPITGAEYTVYSNSALTSSVGKLTTKADGTTNTLTLAPGTYYVKETKAPEGWKIDTNTYTADVKSTQTFTVTSTEAPAEGYLTLLKKIAKDEHLVKECLDQYSIEGAKYGVYTTEAGADGDIASKRVGYLTTKADGSTNKLTLLPGTYYVKEVSAPSGYKLDSKIYSVTIKTGETSVITSKEEPLFDPMDIVLRKIDINGTELPIAGAEFTVKYYKELVTDTTGLTPDRVWVLKTDKDGYINLDDDYKVGGDEFYKTSAGVPVGLIGTYEFTETKAPTGYAAMQGSILRQITKDGTSGDSTIYVYPTIDEYPQTVSITVQKIDAETGKKVPQGHGSFEGAVYEVTRYDSLTDKDVVMGTITLDKNGKGTLGNLEPGVYEVREIKAPAGYLKNNEVIKIKAGIKEINTANFDYPVESKETPITVEFNKVDTSGNHVKGATMQVIDKNGNVVEEWVTNGKTHVIKGLPAGDYTLHEAKTPAGYVTADDVSFTVKATTDVQTVKMVDDIIKVNIEKIDIKTKKLLNGVKLQVLDSKGNVVEEFTTNGNAHRIEKLPAGTYTLHEVSTLPGYVLADDLKFEVKAVADIQTVTLANDFTKVEISKTDITTGDPIIGAKLTIKDSKGEKVAEWTTTKDPYYIERLAAGEYTLTETFAPAGFVVSNDVKFTVTATGDIQKVNMKDDYVKVEFIKYDISGQNKEPLEGVTMQLLDKDKKVVDEWTTSTTPYRIDRLAEGKYFLREKETVPGYTLADDKEITVKKIETVQTFSMDNDTTKVEFSKTDIATGKLIVGALLQILDKDHNVIHEWTSSDTIKLIEKLPLGEYILREITAPDGYVKAEDVNFKVDNTGEIQKVEMKDDFTKVELSKTDLTTGEPVVGAKLQIIPLDANGNPKNEVYTEWITTDEPHYIEYIPAGDYILREILTNKTTSDGYVTAEDVKFTVESITAVQKVKMEDDHTKVTIKKVDKDTDAAIKDTVLALIPLDGEGNPKVGETFLTDSTDKNGEIKAEYVPIGKYIVREMKPNFSLGYVTAEDLVVEVKDTPDMQNFVMKDDHTRIEINKIDKETKLPIPNTVLALIPLDDEGNILDGETFLTASTDDNGMIKAEYVPVGKYIIREKTANFELGYVTADDLTIEVKDTADVQSYTMEDDHTKVEITKSDIVTGKPVIGAQLSIIPLDDEGNPLEGETWATWLTEEEPYYIEYLPVGDYILREKVAPFDDGYVTANEVKFTVRDTGEIQKIDMVDDFTKVEITKSDITTGEPVIGAILQIFDSEGKKVDEWTTTKDPHYMERLPIGKYVLVEKFAPAGYLISNEVEFEVKDTDQIQKVDMTDDYTKVEIIKVTGLFKKALEGAKFQLLDASGKVIKEWTSTKEAMRFDRLPVGKYVLKEVAAPNGYVKADDISFEVKATAEVQTIEVENVPVQPETGDSNNLLLWLLAATSSALIGAVATYKRKKEE